MDKMALYKIIIIFLENAGKYSPSNSEITINITLENHQVDFQVADEGIGVQKKKKIIFLNDFIELINLVQVKFLEQDLV